MEAEGNEITIQWTDGLQQKFLRQPDGTWTLEMTDHDPRLADSGRLPRVTDYDQPNLLRVLTRATRPMTRRSR